jgi:glutathione S-transferase
MIRLHHAPGTAAMAPLILLTEIGLPFELVPVDVDAQGHRTPDYLKLNPNGLVPVLVDTTPQGELVLYESAAICLHLVDTHPQAGLAPGVGTTERAHFYKWLVWLTNTLQATLIAFFYPHRWVVEGNAAGAAEVKACAEQRCGALLDQLEAQLADGRTWLLGADYSAVDAYALMLCRWTRNFKRPARSLPSLGAYLQRGLARPSVRQVFEREGLAEPWV